MSKELNPAAQPVNIQIHRIYSKNQRVVIQGLPEEWTVSWNPKIDLRANPRIQEAGKDRIGSGAGVTNQRSTRR